jgi:hypothetical protein
MLTADYIYRRGLQNDMLDNHLAKVEVSKEIGLITLNLYRVGR